MKHTLVATTLLAFALGIISCSSDQKEAVTKTENDVFAIHDEVMPKISEIMKLRKALSERITALDSTQNQGAATTSVQSEEQKNQAILLSGRLQEADSLMMDWMHNYNGDTLKVLETEQALQYLASEKAKIEHVRTKINSSIEQAKQYLGK